MLGAVAGGGVGLRKLRECLRQMLRLLVARARMLVGGERQLVRQAFERRDPHRVRDRRRDRLVQRGEQLRGGRADQFEVLRLIVGDQRVERRHAADFGQFREFLADRLRVRERRREHGDIVDRRLGRVLQREQRLHRFGVRVLQMQRIEVEAQVQEQRQRADHDDQRADQHGFAIAVEIFVDGRERREARRARLAGRREHLQERRQERHVGHERDDHPDARDQPEFGHAAIGGRQEREEARGRGGSGERQRHGDVPRGFGERDVEPAVPVAFLAIAHAELDAEIDAEADEQHHECDRDHVERVNHQQAERGRDREPDEHRKEHRDDHFSRAQREPQDHQHDDEGRHAVQHGAVLDRSEFLVGERLGARQPDRRAVFLR
ncbi:hypothetical protein AWB81_03523 [Caballeronia arationis]|nr:hypothetical protein AWB81_03523 [Caballeronia arationis]